MDSGTRLGWNGPKGTFLVNVEPEPKYIFEILFKLLNQMITNMKDNKIYSAYLRAFFQYILSLLNIKLNKNYNLKIF